MPTYVLLIVLGAALLHASWNALGKGMAGADPLAGTVSIALAGAALALPLLIVTGLPSPASYLYLLASGVIHVIYFLLVGLAYRHADLSAVYPLTRGAAPLLTAAMSSVLLGETMSGVQIGGIALLSCGVLGLGAEAMKRGGLNRPGLIAAALNVCVIVTYTILDGVGARQSANPAGYVVSMLLLTGLFMLPLLPFIGPDAVGNALRSNTRYAFAGGGMIMASYGIALWAMTKAPIGAVAALRETSVLFGTIIAALFLGERFGHARWIAAVIICASLILIRLG